MRQRTRRRSPIASLAAIPVAVAVAVGVAGCTRHPPPATAAPGTPSIPVAIFEAGDALEKPWRKVRVWRDASFDLVAVKGEVAIRAVAEGASAALARRVEIEPATCPILEWSWRIEQGPETADLASRKAEDMAAAVLLAFGDPGLLSSPRPVPTIRYVWTSGPEPVETVVDSPYYPGVIRSIVVRNGSAGDPGWTTERRDLLADYARAFGGAHPDPLRVFALFTDSDHAGTRVEAHFASARVLCTEAPDDATSIF